MPVRYRVKRRSNFSKGSEAADMADEMSSAGAQKRIVFAGAGNVGLQAILCMALVINANPEDSPCCFVVDFDRVEEKDTRKGYPTFLIGWFKAKAAVEIVRMLYGEKTAGKFVPVIAAAQGAPGIFRHADGVFNGTDSSLDAAYISEESRNTWEVRMSTGLFGNASMHTIEVIPQGFTLGEVSYDSHAWADSTRQECKFGLPINSFAGIAQPFGSLTGALSVQLYLAGERSRYRMIRVCGDDILQCHGADASKRYLRESEQLPLSYDETPLGALWTESAMRLRVDNACDILLEFPIPIVARFCEKLCERPYRGFERQPPAGLCLCGRKTICRSSTQEVLLHEVKDIAHRSLLELHAPAGLRFQPYRGTAGVPAST